MSYSWYTHVVVEISGKASKGAAPVGRTLEILDNGVVVASAHEAGVTLGQEYGLSLVLGSVDGNEAGVSLGEHTLQGRITLSNEVDSVSYATESITIGVGQVPVGDVT